MYFAEGKSNITKYFYTSFFGTQLLFILLQCSVTENNAQLAGSKGIHHCIAFNKNNSAHDSSNKIT